MSSAAVTPPAERDWLRRMRASLCATKSPKCFGTVRAIPAAPGLVVEMCPATDPWSAARSRMLSRLRAGAAVIVTLDRRTQRVSVFRANDRPEVFEADRNLVLPDVLPGFSVPVAALFA